MHIYFFMDIYYASYFYIPFGKGHIWFNFGISLYEAEMCVATQKQERVKISLELSSNISVGLKMLVCWLTGSYGATFILATRLWLLGKHGQMNPALVICSSDGWQRYLWSISQHVDPRKMAWHVMESIRFGWQIITWHQLRCLQKGYATNNQHLLTLFLWSDQKNIYMCILLVFRFASDWWKLIIMNIDIVLLIIVFQLLIRVFSKKKVSTFPIFSVFIVVVACIFPVTTM